MDIKTLTSFLLPFIPYLLKLGNKAVEKTTETVAEKFGENAWKKAQKIWSKLSPQLKQNSDFQDATDKVAAKPESDARQAVFHEELKELLEKNPDLAEVIFQIMNEDATDGTSGTKIIQSSIGNKNQVIGQVHGGKVVGNVEGNVNM